MNKSWIVSSGLIVLLGLSSQVLAGSLEPPAGPDSAASAMYSIEAIYQRLSAGTDGEKRGEGFRGPTGPQGSTMHNLNDVMAKAPSNVVDAATTNEVLSGKPFWGLTTNEWGTLSGVMPDRGAVTYTPGTTDQAVAKGYHNGSGKVEGDSNLVTTNIKKDVSIFGVTGTIYECSVRKTGLTNSYLAGDDGEWQKGVAWPVPRFTTNTPVVSGEEVIIDNLAGLMWTKDANIPEGSMDWTNAVKYCVTNMNVGAGYGGYTNWHLPNTREMYSLIHWGFYNPALSDATGTNKWTEAKGPFTGVKSGMSDSYWTSTTAVNYTDRAWYLRMYRDHVGYITKTTPFYVWPVRGGP